MRIGAHVPSADPLTEASTRDADVVQVFLSAPRMWKPPKERQDAAVLAASEVPIYVHAPYLVNVASPNPRVRHPSRSALQATCDAAERIGAAGVVVHGGHVGADADETIGIAHWVKTFAQLETDVPVLIENTAGGQHAMARYVETIARLFDALAEIDVGFCFDTCHAHAAGEDLTDVIERVRAATGRIDLVHANDSKDEPGSGRDRHANLGAGMIEEDTLVAMIAAADAPVVVETPGGDAAQRDDIAWLRERITSR